MSESISMLSRLPGLLHIKYRYMGPKFSVSTSKLKPPQSTAPLSRKPAAKLDIAMYRYILCAGRKRSLHAGLAGLNPRVRSFITGAVAAALSRSFTTGADAAAPSRALTCLKQACGLLEIQAPTEKAYAVALVLYDKDAENQLQKKDAENQLQLQKKDAENQLQKKDAENQLQLELQKKDHQIIVDYYKRRVAYVTQRCTVCLPWCSLY